jgi:hypothetical protein
MTVFNPVTGRFLDNGVVVEGISKLALRQKLTFKSFPELMDHLYILTPTPTGQVEAKFLEYLAANYNYVQIKDILFGMKLYQSDVMNIFSAHGWLYPN